MTAVGFGSSIQYSTKASGRVLIIWSGQARNNIPGAITYVSSMYGAMGVIPAPPAGATSGFGTQYGSGQQYVSGTATDRGGFTCMSIVSLATFTSYWFDLLVGSSNGVNAYIYNVQFLLIEF
jgi:hypothetical protein